MSRNNDEQLLTQEEVETRGRAFEIVEPLLEAMYDEVSRLSAKKHEALANAHKIKAANRLLNDALAILDGEPTRQYLEPFDTDDMPQYSDMVLTLGQFRTALAAFRRRYYSDYSWVADEADDENDDEI